MSPRLPSQIRTSSPEFKENAAHHEALAEDLRRQIERVRQGGSPRSVEKHHARGKLLPRERIDRILDRASPFLELSPLAAHGLYDDAAPSAPASSPASAACTAARSWSSPTTRR
jgi:3-methylcrotonyl-CoA carboxylase beta subunit